MRSQTRRSNPRICHWPGWCQHSAASSWPAARSAAFRRLDRQHGNVRISRAGRLDEVRAPDRRVHSHQSFVPPNGLGGMVPGFILQRRLKTWSGTLPTPQAIFAGARL